MYSPQRFGVATLKPAPQRGFWLGNGSCVVCDRFRGVRGCPVNQLVVFLVFGFRHISRLTRRAAEMARSRGSTAMPKELEVQNLQFSHRAATDDGNGGPTVSQKVWCSRGL